MKFSNTAMQVGLVAIIVGGVLFFTSPMSQESLSAEDRVKISKALTSQGSKEAKAEAVSKAKDKLNKNGKDI